MRASQEVQPDQQQNEEGRKSTFDKLTTRGERRDYAVQLMQKVKGHIPIILETTKDLEIPQNANKLMLVSGSLKVTGFLEFIRSKAKLDESMSLFLFADHKHLVKISDLMGELYTKYRNEDGFLYLKIGPKQVWG